MFTLTNHVLLLILGACTARVAVLGLYVCFLQVYTMLKAFLEPAGFILKSGDVQLTDSLKLFFFQNLERFSLTFGLCLLSVDVSSARRRLK